jgi:hypothetical protein
MAADRATSGVEFTNGGQPGVRLKASRRWRCLSRA